jgi:hypothetical protein
MSIQVAHERREITNYSSPYPGIGKPWFRMEAFPQPQEREPKKPSVEEDATRVRERAAEAPEHVQTIEHVIAQPQEDFSGREIRSNQVDVASVHEESDWNGKVHLGYIPCRTEEALGGRRCTI